MSVSCVLNLDASLERLHLEQTRTHHISLRDGLRCYMRQRLSRREDSETYPAFRMGSIYETIELNRIYSLEFHYLVQKHNTTFDNFCSRLLRSTWTILDVENPDFLLNKDPLCWLYQQDIRLSQAIVWHLLVTPNIHVTIRRGHVIHSPELWQMYMAVRGDETSPWYGMTQAVSLMQHPMTLQERYAMICQSVALEADAPDNFDFSNK